MAITDWCSAGCCAAAAAAVCVKPTTSDYVCFSRMGKQMPPAASKAKLSAHSSEGLLAVTLCSLLVPLLAAWVSELNCSSLLKYLLAELCTEVRVFQQQVCDSGQR